MGLDHSFDIVSRVDHQEVSNAVNVTLKEIRNRFDFKNSRADIVLDKEKMTLVAEDDFKIKALRTTLEEKLVKRKVPLRALEYGRIEDGANRTVKQDVVFQAGIPIEKAREIVKLVKRKVPLRALEYGRIEDGANRTVKQDVVFQAGIPIEKAREIVKLVKAEKFKAQVAIQGDEVRVSSAKIDVLQEVIAFLKAKDLGIHMTFMNFR